MASTSLVLSPLNKEQNTHIDGVVCSSDSKHIERAFDVLLLF
jgi:hypothetical protein